MHPLPLPDQARREASSPKVKLIRALQDDAIRRRNDRVYDSVSMAVTARLLEINPEVLTAWNFRREAIVSRSPVALTDRASDTVEPFPLTEELVLTERCLRKHPKSYPSWHHRKWVVRRLTEKDRNENENRAVSVASAAPTASGAVLRKELRLSQELLDVDDRNFHGWTYRRFVVSLLGDQSPDSAELEYAGEKIETNFSNYSAWHHRTKVLPRVRGERLATPEGDDHARNRAPREEDRLLPESILNDEYELVQQAFFTEPEDQAGWMYHRWLTAHAARRLERDAAASEPSPGVSVLERQAEMCAELCAMEPTCKWPLATLARLKKLTGTEEGRAESRRKYAELESLDPMRRGYYRDCGARR
jgi:geranylgeranyl transferase type-2 subunit alpha